MRSTKWIIDISNQIENELCPNCPVYKTCNDNEIWCDKYGELLAKKVKEHQEMTT